MPPTTRLLKGQETWVLLRSISTTSMLGSSMRTYLAATEPPKPAPMTTTRRAPPLGMISAAWPIIGRPAAPAPAPRSLRKLLRSRVMSCSPLFLGGVEMGDGFEVFARQVLGLVGHLFGHLAAARSVVVHLDLQVLEPLAGDHGFGLVELLAVLQVAALAILVVQQLALFELGGVDGLGRGRRL